MALPSHSNTLNSPPQPPTAGALSVAAGTISSLYEPVVPSSSTNLQAFLAASCAEELKYKDFGDTIIHRPPSPTFSSSDCNIFDRVITPYNADAFENLLQKHDLLSSYPLLVHNLKHGFPLGEMPALPETIILPNHPSTHTYISEIDDYLKDEVLHGRMSGPFSKAEAERILRGPFFSSPLIVSVQIQQPGVPDKIRICRHLSKPSKVHKSVNFHISKKDFPTRFDTASKVADLISLAPPGTQACTLDIAKFHRTCPVRPSHKPWLVVQGQPGKFYIDHCFPFGAASASSNAGMIANAVVDIWAKEGVQPVCKYEDDLKALRYPTSDGTFYQDGYRYRFDRAEMLSKVVSLGVPWHPDKGDLVFSSSTTFIGFQWHIQDKTVSLPAAKRLKFQRRVQQFVDQFSSDRCLLLDVEKIYGSLCHIVFVHKEGRSRLPSLSNFAVSFHDNETERRYPPSPVMKDLKWWITALSIENFSRTLQPRGPLEDLGLFVNASTSWGIGIIIGDQWTALQLAPDWKIPGRDICWLETLAIEFLVYLLEALEFPH